MAGALSGLKVIDFTQMLAGPYCTMMLADQGADVIKIESPAGDLSRSVGPYVEEDKDRLYGGYYQSINSNKRSVVLDLRQPEAVEVAKALVRDADVVVENFRVGVMEKLGLSFEALREENQRLVYASIRGFGDPRGGDSPYKDWPAFDVVAQAMGGIMGITGPSADHPVKVGPGVGDVVPGMAAAFGILSACFSAKITGKGQYVDIGMVDTILALCERIVYQHAYTGLSPAPEGNLHPFLCPFGFVKAKDGMVAIACQTEKFWQKLCAIIGRPDLAQDSRFQSMEGRAAAKEEVYGAITAFTVNRTRKELMEALGGLVPFGPVFTMDDIVEDPHFAARNMIVPMSATGSSRDVYYANTPIKLTETPGGIRTRAPQLGEHTQSILQGQGYSDDLIQQLRLKGAIA